LQGLKSRIALPIRAGVLTALIVLASACALASGACALWAATRSLPARVLRQVAEVTDRQAEVEDRERQRKAALDAWLEEAEGVLESVERKRRRIAGHASAGANGAALQGEPHPSDPNYRAYVEARARSRGLL